MPEEFDIQELNLIFRGLSSLEAEFMIERFIKMNSNHPLDTNPFLPEGVAALLKSVALLKAKLVRMEDALIANIDELPK